MGYLAGLSLAAWVVVISVTRGRALQRVHREVMLGAAPFVGGIRAMGGTGDSESDWSVPAWWPSLLAAAVWRGWFDRAAIRTIVAASLGRRRSVRADAGADGRRGRIAERCATPDGVPRELAQDTTGGRSSCSTFLDTIDRYSVHVRGHPPGFVLVLKFMAAMGLSGPWPAALLSVVSTGVLVAAVLTTVRAVAGQEWVRRLRALPRAGPLRAVASDLGRLVLHGGRCGRRCRSRRWAPTPVLAGSVGCAGRRAVARLADVSDLSRCRLRARPLPFVVAAAIRRRAGTWPSLAGALVGASTVVVGFRVAGFWWVDGARQTRTQYWLGTAQFRTWDYFKYANIAVLLVAIGPAAIVGLTRLRDPRMWLLSGGGLAAVAASHFSQYTRGRGRTHLAAVLPVAGDRGRVTRDAHARRSATAWVGLQAVVCDRSASRAGVEVVTT